MSGCLHTNSMFLFSRIGNGQIGWRITVENSKKSFKWPNITKNVQFCYLSTISILRIWLFQQIYNFSRAFNDNNMFCPIFGNCVQCGWSWHIWHPKNWLPQSITEKLTVLIDFYTSKRRLKSNWWKNRKNRLFGIRSQCATYINQFIIKSILLFSASDVTCLRT